MKFNERLKEARLKAGKKSYEVAQALGVSKSTYSSYESGRREPDVMKVKELAKILNVSGDDLIGTGFEAHVETHAFENLFIPQLQKIPMIGAIACGEPIYADEEHGEFVEADSSIKADFCLRAEGDSMIDARIRNGDIVFCRKADMVNNGQIAAVIIGEEATLKRFYYYPESNLVILKPANPEYPDLIYQGEQLNEIRVIGRAVAAQIKV